MLRVVFGFDELPIPDHGLCQRAIQTLWLPLRRARELPGDLDVLQVKRKGLWRAQARNTRIAKLARAVSEGRRHPLLDAQEVNTWPGQSVAIVVENTEHWWGTAGATSWLAPGDRYHRS
jgi:hypothetical protein